MSRLPVSAAALGHYVAMLKHLPECMRPVVTFAYVTGWRINSEVLPMEWWQVDLKGRGSTQRAAASSRTTFAALASGTWCERVSRNASL